jgi:hypothetical protein
MAGANISTFSDFLKATNEKKFTGVKDVINDAVNRTYWLADAMMGRSEDEIVKAGNSITDRWQGATSSQFGFYSPNDQFTPNNDQTLSKLAAPWTFAKDAFAWTDEEIELNTGDAEVIWVDLAFSKRQACEISLLNGIEASAWTTPNQNTMESMTNASRPYSIPTFIAENGIQPSGWTTTIEQTDPVANSYWHNQVSNYGYSNIDTTLVPAMEALWRLVNFESPGTQEQYFRETKFKKMKIYTNLDGWKTLVRLTRQNNDRSYPTNDIGYAVNDPTFGRIPVKWVEALESYGYATGQPRFFYVNYEYLFPVWHAKRYMYETDPIPGGPTQPFSHVVYKNCYFNIFCRSRYRQGIIVPQ